MRRIRITREKEDIRSVNVKNGIFLGNGKEKEKRKKNGDLVEIPQRKKKKKKKMKKIVKN